jgi:hypothetical protein
MMAQYKVEYKITANDGAGGVEVKYKKAVVEDVYAFLAAASTKTGNEEYEFLSVRRIVEKPVKPAATTRAEVKK